MPRIAVLRDRLERFHGTAKITLMISEMFNNAPIYTYSSLDEIPKRLQEKTSNKGILIFPRKKGLTTNFPKHVATIIHFSNLKLPDFDLIINIGPFSKWYKPKANQKFVSYCHAPIWSIWPNYANVLEKYDFPMSLFFRIWARIVREGELSTLEDIDLLITNSDYSNELAEKYWGISTKIVYPPVPVSKYENGNIGNYYLMIQPVRGYDRSVLETFDNLPYRLKIIGSCVDPIKQLIKKLENVELLGYVSEKEKVSLLANCRGLIGSKRKEQFGMVPVEAMASGKPVVALKEGGYTVTVEEDKTGVFFKKHDSSEILKAIKKSESISWNPQKIQNHAKKFDESVFENTLKEIVNSCLGE